MLPSIAIKSSMIILNATFRKHRKRRPAMKTTTERQQHCLAVRLLRGALFSLGGFYILASLVIAAFRLAGPDAFYSNIVMMGCVFGIPLLILGLLAGVARYHQSVRMLLLIALAGAGSIIAGFTLIWLAGDERTPLGGVGFAAVLSGMLVLPIAFLASVLAVIVVNTLDRHDQRNRGGPAVANKQT
jgi:hypothetical protein